MNLQPITVYEVVQEPTTQTTISDVLLGVVWVVLGLAVAAVVLGLVCAWILIVLRRMRGEGRPSADFDATRLGLDASSDARSKTVETRRRQKSIVVASASTGSAPRER